MTIRSAMALLLLGVGTFGSTAWAQENTETPPTQAQEADVAEGASGEEAPVDEEAMASERRRELKTVEEAVHGLKERVFRSKATLSLLRELVIEGATLGSRVSIWHENKLGGAFGLQSVQYFLDGKSIYSKADPSGELADISEFKVREQTIAPGAHTLQVNLVMAGRGFGVFTYLESYHFKVQSSYAFEVADGELTTIRVIANTKKRLGDGFVDRVNVQYETWSDQLKAE